MKKVIIFDEFTNQCPYFYNSGTNVNNGYNCAHPDCDGSDAANTKYLKDCEIGRCHTSTCPLVPEADKEDFDNPEIDKDGLGEWEDVNEGEYVVVDVPEESKEYVK